MGQDRLASFDGMTLAQTPQVAPAVYREYFGYNTTLLLMAPNGSTRPSRSVMEPAP